MRQKRIYRLGNQTITSGECYGFLHTLRKFNDTLCMGCDETIKKGEQYIQLNVHNADPLCLDCFLFPAVLGVKQYYKFKIGYVDCEYFPDRESINTKQLRIDE